MTDRDPSMTGLDTRPGTAQAADDLPYCIELWTPGRERVERVLGRAASAQLARAILAGAQTEYPGRRLTIRRGDDMVSDTAR